MTVAILALQGAFIEHAYMLDKLKVEHFEFRQLSDLNRPFDGLILPAKGVEGGIVHLGTMDITAKRNAYGRQLGSFHTVADFSGLGMIPMTFIRAPYIVSVSGDAQILAQTDNRIVAARQGNQLITAFHPELDESTKVHEFFIVMIKERSKVQS